MEARRGRKRGLESEHAETEDDREPDGRDGAGEPGFTQKPTDGRVMQTGGGPASREVLGAWGAPAETTNDPEGGEEQEPEAGQTHDGATGAWGAPTAATYQVQEAICGASGAHT